MMPPSYNEAVTSPVGYQMSQKQEGYNPSYPGH
jgi:hypothetical protein